MGIVGHAKSQHNELQKSSTPPQYHLRLQPSTGWVSLKLHELWEYRELLYFLTWRDVKVRYKQTVLGAAWAIIQPLMTMVVFSLFFGNLANVPSDSVPYPLLRECAAWFKVWAKVRVYPIAPQVVNVENPTDSHMAGFSLVFPSHIRAVALGGQILTPIRDDPLVYALDLPPHCLLRLTWDVDRISPV